MLVLKEETSSWLDGRRKYLRVGLFVGVKAQEILELKIDLEGLVNDKEK